MSVTVIWYNYEISIPRWVSVSTVIRHRFCAFVSHFLSVREIRNEYVFQFMHGERAAIVLLQKGLSKSISSQTHVSFQSKDSLLLARCWYTTQQRQKTYLRTTTSSKATPIQFWHPETTLLCSKTGIYSGIQGYTLVFLFRLKTQIVGTR